MQSTGRWGWLVVYASPSLYLKLLKQGYFYLLTWNGVRGKVTEIHVGGGSTDEASLLELMSQLSLLTVKFTSFINF